ncbi:Oxidoreductase [Lachnellula willkommii]|uniref:Oxidoreductase n=1 Tax=Lachnellula willkommii TaxID=215461 RepID=A0A559MGT2_9HELO|nr:Oxidoreductase [Lachnellula willkommii]
MTALRKPISLVLGAGNFSTDPSRIKDQREMVDLARKNNIKTFDTSRYYSHGQSETFLGNEGISSEFEIITKASGGKVPGGLSKEGVLKGWAESQAALKVERVGTYLIHVPDADTSIADTMEGIQELHLAGKFDKARQFLLTFFGLSNFSPQQVEECYDYAKSKGYILPTCYQSIYGLVSRKNEKDLFPLLRRLGISIQAYSPLASGFLVKTPEDVRAGVGNFDPSTVLGKILQDMYATDSLLDYLQKFGELAEEIGSSKVGLACRWVVWNSALREDLGDCMVSGASRAKQLQDVLDEIEKGPLEDSVVERLEKMWKDIEADAPGDNFSTFRRLQKAGVL